MKRFAPSRWKPAFAAALAAGLLAVFARGGLADDRDAASVFGSAQRSAGALIGILYDFKQNQKREPVPMDRNVFEKVVAQFINGGWDEGLLNKYYRVPRALYATELLIPTIDADTAPRAFGVEKTVQPRMWMVHYKGQVAAPADGAYRFLGDADDFVAVAVNGETVLVADIPGTRLQVKWFAREPEVQLSGKHGGRFIAGDWINLRAGQPVDLDIITGESPGGQMRCQLAVQKKGVDTGGEMPPFQLSVNGNTPAGAAVWKGVQ